VPDSELDSDAGGWLGALFWALSQSGSWSWSCNWLLAAGWAIMHTRAMQCSQARVTNALAGYPACDFAARRTSTIGY
jgi:hypothetical protein